MYLFLILIYQQLCQRKGLGENSQWVSLIVNLSFKVSQPRSSPVVSSYLNQV